jgi:hypothetical protein
MTTIQTIAIDPADGRIDPGQYATLKNWWLARAGQAPPRPVLPTLGVISSHHDTPMAACFAYLDATGSGIAILAWHITDPAAHPRHAGRALKHAIRFLEDECARLNYWLAWTATSSPSLASYLAFTGYHKAEQNITHLFRALPPLKSETETDPVQPSPQWEPES